MNPFSRSHKDKIAGDAASILQEAQRILRGETLEEALSTKADRSLKFSNYGEPVKGLIMHIADRGPLFRAFGQTISLPHRKSDEYPEVDTPIELPKSKDGHNLEFSFQNMPHPENLDRDAWQKFVIPAIQKWLNKSPYNNWKHLYYQPLGIGTPKGNAIHDKIAIALAKKVGGKLLSDFKNGYHIKR